MNRQCNLTYEEFEQQARRFVEKAKKLQDGWELTEVGGGPHKGRFYLVKKRVQELTRDSVPEKSSSLEDLAGDTSDLNEHEDEATVVDKDKTSEDMKEVRPEATLIHVEYHIVHSYSYLVPILYWNAAYSDGRPLSLAEIWRLLETVPAGADKWGVVTQQEHPYLGRPFYHIHPCHTAEAMAKAKDSLVGDHDAWDYLTSWLSMFGVLTGLNLPMGYSEVSS